MNQIPMKQTLYVPECPTLYPGMLWRAPNDDHRFPPFDARRTHWFYFARNALWHAWRRLDLAGAEVLMPSYHHGVEVEALVHAGARPVFYRVGSRWDVDMEDVESKIGPETRALYLIHYAGFPGPAREMKRLAERRGLLLIEDCALSLLSSDGGTPLGSTGDLSLFCLYKTLPVPNGGALTFNTDLPLPLPDPPPPPTASVFSHTASALLKNLEMRGGPAGRSARAGVRRIARGAVRAGKVERVATGTSHFDPAHVGLGISRLTLKIARSQPFEQIIERRRHNYLQLLDALSPLSPPLFETLPAGVCPLFYPIVSRDKQALLARLREAGIEAVDFWRDHHPACDRSQFPETITLRESIVEVPCHQDMDDVLLARMIEVVVAALRETERSTTPTDAMVH